MTLTQVTTEGIKAGTITGSDLATNVDLVDNQKLRLGASQDLQIYHDGSNSIVFEGGTGTLKLATAGGSVDIVKGADSSETMAKFIINGAVELYHDNNKKFETTANGADLFNRFRILGGTAPSLQLNSDSTGSDTSTRAMFGMATGSNNFINGSTTSDVVLNTPHRFIIGHATNEIMAIFDPDGAVQLRHDNSTKFETLSDGVSIPNDNDKLKIGASQDLYLWHNGSTGNSNISNVTGDLFIQGNDGSGTAVNQIAIKSNAAVELNYQGTKKFETTSGGVNMPSGTAVFGGVSGSSWTVEVNPIAANPYGLNITEPSTVNDGYPLFQVSNNDGSIPRFRVLSGGVAQTSRVQPYQTNTHNLGSSTRRWAAIFSVNDVNTSDKNLKNSIADSDLGLSFINKLRPVSYKWNQIEGENLDTKTHYGFIAQEMETALISENKTLDDYAGVYKPDDYKEDGTGEAMGIQTNHILSPLVKAVQELSNKVKTLETEVASLKAT